MGAVHHLVDRTDSSSERPETILVVDDSRAQLRLLSTYLARWGYDVIQAESGEAALKICQKENPDLIVSDWMMPGMSGPELCQRYKKMRGDRYVYFILLTSKSDKGEVAEGLDIGADDFLTKPFNAPELRARIQAGQRILGMERELKEKNRLVSKTLEALQTVYDAVDRDLIEARKLQQSLVRERFCQFENADVSLMLQPAGHVGGDLVGVFPVNDDEIGIYSLDVSGHGVASALLTARLAAYLSGNSPRENIAITEGKDGTMEMCSPASVVAKLNALIMDEMETEHYFTILMGKVCLKTGKVTLTQAGHPHPVVQRANGDIEFHGHGGLPVGLIRDAEYTEFELQLHANDRLFLGSDGITECADPDGNLLDDIGLKRLLIGNAELAGLRFFDALAWDLATFVDDKDFGDDVSGLLLEYQGAR